MKRVLVLCTGNSCRSQMAHGYLAHFLAQRARVYSAGVETHGVHPLAVQVMKDDHIDIAHHTSNHISEYQHIDFDYILTVCDHAKEACPRLTSGAVYFHHDFFDPSKTTGEPNEVYANFVRARDEIKNYCLELSQKIVS